VWKIHLKEDAHPVAVPVLLKMLIAYREDVYVQLDEQEEQGVFAKVPYPRDWCHPWWLCSRQKEDGRCA